MRCRSSGGNGRRHSVVVTFDREQLKPRWKTDTGLKCIGPDSTYLPVRDVHGLRSTR
jgi:hypothetical protein